MNGGAASGMAAAAIAHQRKKILKAFREAGALGAERAASRVDLGIRKSFLFRRMVQTGALVDCGGGERYYLDEEAVERDQQRRQQRVMWILAAAALVVAVAWIFARS